MEKVNKKLLKQFKQQWFDSIDDFYKEWTLDHQRFLNEKSSDGTLAK